VPKYPASLRVAFATYALLAKFAKNICEEVGLVIN
jgi:hypothetical protein